MQAFSDVNKRTARLSANIPLIRENLVPLAFSDVRVEDYMSAMIAVYELQKVTPLIDLYVYSYFGTDGSKQVGWPRRYTTAVEALEREKNKQIRVVSSSIPITDFLTRNHLTILSFFLWNFKETIKFY